MDIPMQKELIVSLARKMANKVVNKRAGGCLYYSMATMTALDYYNIPSILQAGSCSWPRLTKEQDDGKETTFTHFSYMFEPDSELTKLKLLQDELPEMHVWVYIPSTKEIVDLTTNEFPEQCMSIIKQDWPGIKPPDYFWCKVNAPEWPDGVYYLADKAACKIAIKFIKEIIEVH